MIAAIDSNPSIKLVFLCSPGNPTAKLVPIEDTKRIAEACGACRKGGASGRAVVIMARLTVCGLCVGAGDRAMVVVDEAYIDFAKKGPGQPSPSACQLVDSYPNIIVLQTLSKAFGLAGIR